MHNASMELKPKKRFSKLGLAILVLLLITLVGFPLFWMTLSSLKPATELFKIPPSILPKQPTLDWYRAAFSDSTVLHYFWNSLRIAVATMLIDMVIGTMAAYSLTHFHYRGRKFLTAGVLSAYCIPPIMLMIPLYRIIAGINLQGNIWGVIIGHISVTLPFSIWLLISFFSKLPIEIDEAASVDGASVVQTFMKIDLPLCVPGILSTGIMAFILSWNEYLLSSVLISRDTMKTLTVGLANHISSTQIDWGIIMALGTATTIPIVILFTLIQKYFVEGLTAGAVKG